MSIYPDTARARRNKRRALWATVLIHGALGALAFYLVAWSPPDPPLPEYGIEVSFGTDEGGFGETQPLVPPGEPEPSPPQPEQETQDALQAEAEESEESPVAVAKPTRPAEKPETKPQPKPAEKPQPKPNEETLLKPQAGKPGGGGQSHGNQPGKTGDQGSPNGSLNSDALLGKGGGGGGAKLDMPGWRWTEKPNMRDSSSETGQVTLEIKIDAYGQVISVRTLYRSVSRNVAAFYEQHVRQMNFEPTTDADVDGVTTGKITFIITN